MIDAVSPCVLWIDEVEKGLSGTESSGKSDGGTTSRVFGTLLTWMQDHESMVFPIATANDVSALPPELIRRFDEVFAVLLPSLTERISIWTALLKRYKREPVHFDLESLAQATDGYTGAEIEKIIVEGLYKAYSSKAKKLTDTHLAQSVSDVTPISTVMGDKIANITAWSEKHARLASVKEYKFNYSKPIQSGGNRSIDVPDDDPF
jgi:SpoVK/Ycf46/Vps4 family AAA+-type ATPase